MKSIGRILLAAVLATSSVQAQAKTAKGTGSKKRKPTSDTSSQPARPPQFVLLAFDGSKDNDFWATSMATAQTIPTTTVANQPTTIKFTYFVNPTYYTGAANKANYITPELNKSLSCIGWASDDGTSKSIPLRVSNTNKAFLAGHEIGSHANSHCDQSGKDSDNPMHGRPWSAEDWDSEFNQFNKLLFGTFAINKLTPLDNLPSGFAFSKDNIKGFRAPLLATTPGLFPTLGKYGFNYNSSSSGAPRCLATKTNLGWLGYPTG